MRKKRVRTLLRVSSRQQLHNDDIPIQRAEAMDYIAKRPDWEFDREYIEKAVSAYKNSVQDREVLQEIMADARERAFDVLLTYMSDRIGRQEEYSFYVTALNQSGVEVWTIKDGQLKTEEHIDKLLNYIRFWQNEGESRKTSARVRDAQQEMVKAGKFVGGRAPFGYRLVSSGEVSNRGRLLKKLEIVEQDAAIVRKIYELAIWQGFGYDRIATTLNEEGIPPIAADKWKPATIAGILKNPIYMGYYAINRRVNHGSCTRLDRRDWIYSQEQQTNLAILSPEEWERAQEIREARKAKMEYARQTASARYEAQHGVPFSTKGRLSLIGLVYCGYCGKKLKNGSYCNHWTVKSTGERKTAFTGRYICPEKCPRCYCYSQSYLENAVFEVAEKYLESREMPDFSKEIQKKQQEHREYLAGRLGEIEKQQYTLQRDIETLEEKIPETLRGESCFSAQRLAALIREKEEALEILSGERERMKKEERQAAEPQNIAESFLVYPTEWKEIFREMNPQNRQMLLSLLFEKIQVTKDSIIFCFRVQEKAAVGKHSSFRQTGQKIFVHNREVEIMLKLPAEKNEKAEEALTNFLRGLYMKSVLATPVKIS